MHDQDAPVLCIDVPSGLMADTGQWLNKPVLSRPSQRHTLTFLTLKQGLFTADGRDAAGKVWFNALSETEPDLPAQALLQGRHPQGQHPFNLRQHAHNTHKGQFGDVQVIGGANGMAGAAVLAANAALHGGAGRVFLGLLDGTAQASITASYPALMVRDWRELPGRPQSAVCGCGGFMAGSEPVEEGGQVELQAGRRRAAGARGNARTR